MANTNFSLNQTSDHTPKEVFDAILNVRGWWSENIEGGTAELNDEFTYRYKDMHRCKVRIIEVTPNQRIVWHILENYFSFTEDKTEWIDTKAIFEITEKDGKTHLHFTHEGLVPAYECYSACVNGWTQYISQSLPSLINTGVGMPNTKDARTTHEVALRFNELAQQEKWFDIQDELFADDVKSIDPENSPYFNYAEGKVAVRKKGEDFVKRVEEGHRRFTTAPVIAGNHFAVGREVDITVQGHGRIQINEIMLYEVKEGKIVMEQFFY